MLKLHVLASGSKGNAAIVENAKTGTGVLIDCGICKRDFLERCDQAGFDPTGIEAVLITHEHGDHTKGLGVVLRGLAKLGCAPTIFANRACIDASSTLQKIADDFDISPLALKQGSIEVAGLNVLPFATSHDAAASFGFRVEASDGDALGYITDSGIVTSAAHEALLDVRILALESNHDETMLQNGSYPYVIKRRNRLGIRAPIEPASHRGACRPYYRISQCGASHTRNRYRHARLAKQQRLQPAKSGA